MIDAQLTNAISTPLTGPLRISVGAHSIDVGEIATMSKDKLREFQEAGLELQGCHIDIVEAQPSKDQYDKIKLGDFITVSREIAAAKAESAFHQLGRPVLVEDTSLWVNALPFQTGPLIKSWMQEPRDGDRSGLEQLCIMATILNNRNATAICTLGVSDGRHHSTWCGVVRGHIAESPRGEHGFGWDKIFIPEPAQQYGQYGHAKLMTWAEMTAEQKLKLFPFRGAAVAELRKSATSIG